MSDRLEPQKNGEELGTLELNDIHRISNYVSYGVTANFEGTVAVILFPVGI